MIPVEEALARVLALCEPLPQEEIPLTLAAGRVLSRPLAARHDQPPFDASAMDGYALNGPGTSGSRLRLIGEAGAGHGFEGRLGTGEAIRIFTGAPLPEGADRIAIQEEVSREDGFITLTAPAAPGAAIRPRGGDFRKGETLSAPRRLRPEELGLLAAMGHARIHAIRRPVVALIATGDELVAPGEPLAPGQITASSVVALKALAEEAGAEVRLLPIARDNAPHLRAVLELAEGADIITTTGGASVGDHDIVRPVAESIGAQISLHRIAMRPGKPLMAGRLGRALFLGLPGNPVSALVCARLFLLPALRALSGLGRQPPRSFEARLAEALPANGPRAHYMRAMLEPEGRIRPLKDQDSSLLATLVRADALLIRPIADPARPEGEPVRYLPLHPVSG